MSNITNIIISLGWDDSIRKSCALAVLDEYMQENYSCQFQKIGDYTGGNKAFEGNVYMIAVNYLSATEFIKALRSCIWEDPEYLQIFWKGEHEDIFTLFGWMELLDPDVDIVSRIDTLWRGEGLKKHNKKLSPIRGIKFISSRLTRNPDGTCSIKKYEMFEKE